MVTEEIIRKASNIMLVATDIDGVWTDGRMYYSAEGEYMKAFSTYDGMAVQLLREQNIPVAVLTGEDSEVVKRRMEKIKIEHLFYGETQKLESLKKLCRLLSLDLSKVAYIGDDINDLNLLRAVGFSAMPGSSPILHLFTPDYVTQRAGGQGAFREFVDIILLSKQKC